MYKTDYTEDDYFRVTEECAERIRKILQDHFAELEEERDAINDFYPWEDWFLAMQKVDDGRYYIRSLLKHLDECTIKKKKEIKKNRRKFFKTPRKKTNKKRLKTNAEK